MMTEMLAALLAIALALGSVSAVAQLSSTSQRAQSRTISKLASDRQTERLLSQVVTGAAAPVRPETTLVLAARLTYACGSAPHQVCQLIVDDAGASPRLVLLEAGREVGSSPIRSGQFRILATIQQFNPAGAHRLAGPLSLVEAERDLRPTVTAQQSRRVDADCRFDPVSSVCSEGR